MLPGQTGLTGSKCGILFQKQKGSLFMVKIETVFCVSITPCSPPNTHYLGIRDWGHCWEEPLRLGGFPTNLISGNEPIGRFCCVMCAVGATMASKPQNFVG